MGHFGTEVPLYCWIPIITDSQPLSEVIPLRMGPQCHMRVTPSLPLPKNACHDCKCSGFADPLTGGQHRTAPSERSFRIDPEAPIRPVCEVVADAFGTSWQFQLFRLPAHLWTRSNDLTHYHEKVIAGFYGLFLLLIFVNGVVRRVARSTLAAEGYALSETQETLPKEEVSSVRDDALPEAYPSYTRGTSFVGWHVVPSEVTSAKRPLHLGVPCCSFSMAFNRFRSLAVRPYEYHAGFEKLPLDKTSLVAIGNAVKMLFGWEQPASSIQPWYPGDSTFDLPTETLPEVSNSDSSSGDDS